MRRLTFWLVIFPQLAWAASRPESYLLNTEPRFFDFRKDRCLTQQDVTWIQLDRKKLLTDLTLWACAKRYQQLDPKDSVVKRVADNEFPQIQKFSTQKIAHYDLTAFKRRISDKTSVWMLVFSWETGEPDQIIVAVGFVMELYKQGPKQPIDLTHLESEQLGFDGVVMVSAVYRHNEFEIFRSDIHWESLLKQPDNNK
jgi:hypothetical protein